MLRFIIGKAGTGKTAAIYEELRRAVEARRRGRILLVPEQYSHEAERELCRICGDSLSLTAEVLSFTGALDAELQPFKRFVQTADIHQYFDDEWFRQKYVIYLPV